MPRFRLKPDVQGVDLFYPAGHLDSMHVAPGDVVDVPGELAETQPDDAYLVGTSDEARAWPKALWELADTPDEPAAPAEPAPVTEGN